MATNHSPPRASKGERTKGGRRARKPGQTKRQRAIDPEKLRVVREMLVGNVDYYEIQFTLAERWDVSMRTIRQYRQRVIEMMREEIQADGFLDYDMETQLALQQIESLRLRAIAAKDLRAEANAIRLRAQIVGILGPDRHLHLHQPPAPPVGGQLPPGEAQPELDPLTAAKREMALRLAARMRSGDIIDMKPAPGAPQEGTTK